MRIIPTAVGRLQAQSHTANSSSSSGCSPCRGFPSIIRIWHNAHHAEADPTIAATPTPMLTIPKATQELAAPQRCMHQTCIKTLLPAKLSPTTASSATTTASGQLLKHTYAQQGQSHDLEGPKNEEKWFDAKAIREDSSHHPHQSVGCQEH